MSVSVNELQTLLTMLLPGFVTAAILYLFTSYSKPSPFERVIQALVFSFVINAIASLLEWIEYPLFESVPDIVLYFVLAVLLGIIAVYATNHDLLYRFLRFMYFTRETSFPSEWYSAFARNKNAYVVLHLKGERRFYGWPQEWPSDPDLGHFIIAEGEWLSDNVNTENETEKEDDDTSRILDVARDQVLIPVAEVEMVEFKSIR